MIKQLKKYDVQNTPFVATKAWELLNVQHQDLVLVEENSETPLGQDTFVALEFIDYSFGNPQGVLNTDCNIALEQQIADPVLYEEGISGSGLFYPSDRQNPNGTYTRLVYQQILRAFYNNYHNPLRIFGIENVDFQTSGMKRFLSNYFRVFRLEQQKFGDKIVEGSVEFIDNTYDDNYTITDDCQGNLIAWPNLFSRIQEVRHIENDIRSGSADYDCPLPVTGSPEAPILLTGSLTSSISGGEFLLPYLASLSWSYDSTNEDGFNIYRSLTTDGVNWSAFGLRLSTPADITWSVDNIDSRVAGISYYVTAYNMFGESAASNTIVFGPPDSPTYISASAIAWSASYVVWSGSAGAYGYYLFRSDDSGSSWMNVATTSFAVTSSYDHTLEQTSSYSYRVAAYNILSWSYSPTASISTPESASAAPESLLILEVSSGSAILSWSYAETPNSYAISKSLNGSTFFGITNVPYTSPTQSYKDTDVYGDPRSASYFYKVNAIFPASSSTSNVASISFVNPLPPLPCAGFSPLTNITGTITTNYTSPYRGESYYANTHSFIFEDGVTYNIWLRSPIDNYLVLYNSSMTHISHSDSDGWNPSNDSYNGALVFTAVGSNNPYIIEATTYGEGQTGDYTLIIETGSITQSVVCKNAPQQMWYCSASNRIFVGDAQSPTMSIINADTRQLEGQLINHRYLDWLGTPYYDVTWGWHWSPNTMTGYWVVGMNLNDCYILETDLSGSSTGSLISCSVKSNGNTVWTAYDSKNDRILLVGTSTTARPNIEIFDIGTTSTIWSANLLSLGQYLWTCCYVESTNEFWVRGGYTGQIYKINADTFTVTTSSIPIGISGNSGIDYVKQIDRVFTKPASGYTLAAIKPAEDRIEDFSSPLGLGNIEGIVYDQCREELVFVQWGLGACACDAVTYEPKRFYVFDNNNEVEDIVYAEKTGDTYVVEDNYRVLHVLG